MGHLSPVLADAYEYFYAAPVSKILYLREHRFQFIQRVLYQLPEAIHVYPLKIEILSRYARKEAVEHLGAVYVVVSRVYKAYRMLEIEKILALRVNKYHAALSFIYRVICHLDNAL